MSPSMREVLQRADALLRRRSTHEARVALEDFQAENESASESAEFQAMLAQTRLQDRDAEGAVQAADRALEIRPRWADAHQIRALALRDSGALDEALRAIKQAVGLRPEDVRALTNLGVIQLRRGQLHDAEMALRHAAALSPAHEYAWYCLAETLQSQGRTEEAIDAWQRWLALDPESAPARARVGWALAQMNRLSEAERLLSAAVEPTAADPLSAVRLAFVRRERGDTQGALSAYERARSLAPDSLTPRFGSALLLPQIYEGSEDVGQWRDRFERGLASLESKLRRGELQPNQIWQLDWSNFYLGYQGQNDLPFQRRYAAIIETLVAMAAPEWIAPSKPATRGGRLRIAFASSFFRTCTVGCYFKEWLTGLDRTRFEVQVFYHGGEFDAITETIRACADRFERTGPGTREIASAIRRAEPEILIYPQLGMDGRDAALASLRLAPVQCAAWGHPETTGSSAIDYFFSCEDMEPDGASAHYSERLLLLPGLGTRYERPRTRHAARVEFGLPERYRLYTCPHSLFKIHPDNDAMFANLLARDAAARLVVCADAAQPVSSLFMSRLRRSLRSVDIAADERVIVQPLRPPPEFRAMLSVCDVMLDTLHWSGGNTSLDALAAGLPIVSCAGPLMRGRQSAAMLRTLGLDQLVAETPADAVARAIEVAAESGREVRRQIASERDALFDRSEPLDALMEHLLQIRA